jgi:hypothetical protein
MEDKMKKTNLQSVLFAAEVDVTMDIKADVKMGKRGGGAQD